MLKIVNRTIDNFESSRFHFHKITPLPDNIEIEVYGDASLKREETNQQGLIVIGRKSGTQKANFGCRTQPIEWHGQQ